MPSATLAVNDFAFPAESLYLKVMPTGVALRRTPQFACRLAAEADELPTSMVPVMVVLPVYSSLKPSPVAGLSPFSAVMVSVTAAPPLVPR